ncbi:AI-2E family transporter [Massilia sp. PAMC28688]|uniref:AI-2E family transporter n=1 Tax=Massilia sp. PAMC28688 TaxID=2861283 RepID=UPI001C62E7F8|nr:AI-2E family transporter [Massilia sp. PAMC28688]QYF92428.1 AI-2E family transporter [Massilia sp. PAMC28688]
MSDHHLPKTADVSVPGKERDFLHRVVLVNGTVIMFALVLTMLWYSANALLLIFACILFAILLFELSNVVTERTKLKRKYALPLVVLTMFGIIGLGGFLMAPQISDQADKLVVAVPQALTDLRQKLGEYDLARRLLGGIPSDEQLRKQITQMMPNAGLFFSGVLGAVGNVFIITFVGIYFAAKPLLYIEGMVTLVPKRKRERAREVLTEIGRTLAKWLVGKAASMVLVGALTAIGLSVLGVPLALILGIIAGLLDFIPYLGPLMAGVPAVLLAFSISPEMGLYTIGLFGIIQLIEGYLLQPLIEQKTVSLPPALTIVMQVLFGTLFGLAGVALATPLTAVLAVLVTMLYVQDVLGDNVRTPSEQ